jgi:flagellar L-ring protein precursor FlgH
MHNGRNHALIRTTTLSALAASLATWQGVAVAQEDSLVLGSSQDQPAAVAPAATSSLLVQAQTNAVSDGPGAEPHALRAVSMFAISPAESRIFHAHDLIQIIVRESTAARSKHELETEKDVNFKGAVNQWPDLQLSNLLNGWVRAGTTDQLPQVDLEFTKDFQGDGEYERRDDFTARLTSEVLQILPNGNLILESRTQMDQDGESFTLKVTGTCRPQDVTPANTILSSQLHDLKVEKITSGELTNANEKGLFTKIIDFLFAF